MNKIGEKIKSFRSSVRSRKLLLREQIHFFEELAFLLHAGIPLLPSLTIIQNQNKQKRKAFIFETITQGVSEGRAFSQTLKPFVSHFAGSIIYAGEESGFLSTNLFHLAKHLKRKRAMIHKIFQAFIYPSAVAFATVGITIFLILYIFPKILPIIKSLHVALPFTTKAVLFLSSFFIDFWIIILAVFLFSLILILYLFKRNRLFTFFVHRYLLRVPIMGSMYRDFLLTHFCNNLRLLLEGGLTIDKGLEITRAATSNIFLQSAIGDTHRLLLAGGKFSEGLFSYPEIFPETFSQIVHVGEETGALAPILANLAERFEEEFSEKIKNISQTIEPLLLMVAGFVVGFIAISIISPVYEITQNLQKR